MRHLRINENPIDFSSEQGDTMESILVQIASLGSDTNEYPVKVVVDGREYATNDQKLYALSLDTIDSVDVHTFSPKMLREELPQLDEIPHLLQSGKRMEAMNIVVQLVTLINQMVLIIPLLSEEYRQDAKPHVEALTQDLNTLHQSIADEDFILVGDVLEYEIRGKLTRLLDAVRA